MYSCSSKELSMFALNIALHLTLDDCTSQIIGILNVVHIYISIYACRIQQTSVLLILSVQPAFVQTICSCVTQSEMFSQSAISLILLSFVYFLPLQKLTFCPHFCCPFKHSPFGSLTVP